MKCYYHPDIDAVATCVGCGKAVCQNCAVDVAGKFYCQQCLASVTVAKVKTPDTRPVHNLAVASFALGILGVLACCCASAAGSIVFGIPAVITGWKARKEILEGGEQQRGKELALIGLGLGIAELAWGAIFIVLMIVGVGIPTLFALLSELQAR